MGRALSEEESEAAALFARAAAALAEEAVAATRRLGADVPVSRAALESMSVATASAQRLSAIAETGGNLQEAYRIAAVALESAALALAEAKDTPWVHRIVAVERVVLDETAPATERSNLD